MTTATLTSGDDQMIAVKDLAKYGIGRNTAFRLMSEGSLPYLQFGPGGRRKVPLSAVLRLVEQNIRVGNGTGGVIPAREFLLPRFDRNTRLKRRSDGLLRGKV